MFSKKIIYYIFLSICIGLPEINAQGTVPTASGDSRGEGYSLSFAIGQIVYHINEGTTDPISKSIQQSYEKSKKSNMKKSEDLNLEFIVYPNPVTDFLTIKTEGYIPSQCKASLYDINGLFLKSKNIIGNETIFEMGSNFVSIYFLKVSVDGRQIKTVKIIKN